jgi:hypothetical protein
MMCEKKLEKRGLGEEFESHRGSQNVGDKKMPQENYRRIRKGYEPEEPTTVGEQLFYISLSLLYGSKIWGRRIRSWIMGKLAGANK